MRTNYILESVLTGLRRNVTMTIALILNTAITLTFVGAALLANKEISQFTSTYESRLNVSVFVCAKDDTRKNCPERPVLGADGKQQVVNGQKQVTTGATSAQIAAIRAKLGSDPQVRSFSFVSEREQYNNAKKSLPAGTASSISVGDLPASFTVRLNDVRNDYQGFVKRFATVAGVGEVDNQSSVLNRLLDIIDGFRLLSVLIAVIVLIASILLIANTIQVAAQQRRNETSIMRLVGASRWMTELPFLLETIVATIVGGAIALGMLFGGKYFVFNKIFGLQVGRGVIPNLGTTQVLEAAGLGLVAGIIVTGLTAFATLRLYVKL